MEAETAQTSDYYFANPPKASLRRGLTWTNRHRVFTMSLVLILAMGLVAVFGDSLKTHDQARIVGRRLQSPSSEHWFGTDNIGRDVFSRIIIGSRLTLAVGIGGGLLGTILGGALGSVCGFVGGKFDLFVQRLVDIVLSFPSLVLALALAAALGQSTRTVIVAIVIAGIPGASRVLRSAAIGAAHAQFVEAARATGATEVRIFLRYILPHCIPAFTIIASIAIGGAIGLQAALAFLGIGPPPPAVSWGQMMSGSTLSYVQAAPWLLIAPGLAISLAIYAFNLFGDSLNDLLRPTDRQR